MPGPVPKRSSERRRRNRSNDVETVKASGVVAPVEPDELWHPIAADWFRSLAESGQAQYYEPSDWQAARYIAEAMSRNLASGKFSAQLFAAVMSGMTDLLTTEGARRRARFEVQRNGESKPESVPDINDYRKRLAGG